MVGPFQTSDCKGNRIFGGMYSLSRGIIKKVFNSLPKHYQYRILFDTYHIDSWDSESVSLYVDSVAISIQTVSFAGSTDICGMSNFGDKIIKRWDVTRNHDSSSLTIEINCNLDSAPCDESFGIKNFFVVIDQCWEYCETCNDNGCLTCVVGAYYLESQK